MSQKYKQIYSELLAEMKKVSNYQFISLIEELESLRIIFNSVGIDDIQIDFDLSSVKQFRLGQVVNNDFKQIQIEENEFTTF